MNAQDQKLVVSEARGEDVGRGIIRLDPQTMRTLSLSSGDTVEIVGDTALAA